MQAITQADGTKRRAFCLTCFKEGKPWIGGDLCEHFQNAQPAGPTGKLDSVVSADHETAENAPAAAESGSGQASPKS